MPRMSIAGAAEQHVTDNAPSSIANLLVEAVEPTLTRYVTSYDGTKLNVQVYGRRGAQPLVLAHGWTCSGAFWRPQINDLAREFRVITYDQRGHGASELGRTRLSPEVLADDLSAVLGTTLQPSERAVIIGHSMGGMTLMSWAEKYPQEVARYATAAMLLSTASGRLTADETVLPGLFRSVPLRPTIVGAAISAPIPTNFLHSSALEYATMGPYATAEQRNFCHSIVRTCPSKVRGKWGTVLGRLDISEALDNLAVPTTVLVGSRDRLTPPVHSYRLRDKLEARGNLEQFIELPHVGHMSPVEAPEAVNSEIRRLAGMPAMYRRVG
ncbi:hydrolase [Hoyosella rhizosphaerae]|uniref:Hydrolase n=2 Tax=Hoyosella rhizosphaerae TaxID=1755582 RepID=A0A916UK46_9ACTN|nr:hydrolase [Hoyosella rhizosphaerae]